MSYRIELSIILIHHLKTCFNRDMKNIQANAASFVLEVSVGGDFASPIPTRNSFSCRPGFVKHSLFDLKGVPKKVDPFKLK